MYLLIFEAWATLMGFQIDSGIMTWNVYSLSYINNQNILQGEYIDNTQTWETARYSALTDWLDLATINPKLICIEQGFQGDYYGITQAQQALMLTNIMTHVSMILIFVFFVAFVIWLFRLFAHMLSRR